MEGDIDFYEYIGLAGDEHVSLIGKRDGIKFSTLINRNFMPNWSLKKGKKRIEKMFEEYYKTKK